MGGRRASTDEQRTDGLSSPSVVLAISLALALGAAAVLVLSSDARWLRMGVVAALWCALVGGFAAAKYRRTAVDRADAATEMRSLYQSELERECAARREYVLNVEAETRRQVERDTKQELGALRMELRTLRESLRVLLGGEVLVERVAVRAESTRMRSLPDKSPLRTLDNDRVIAHVGDRRGLPAGLSATAAGTSSSGMPALERKPPVAPAVVRREHPSQEAHSREAHWQEAHGQQGRLQQARGQEAAAPPRLRTDTRPPQYRQPDPQPRPVEATPVTPRRADVHPWNSSPAPQTGSRSADRSVPRMPVVEPPSTTEGAHSAGTSVSALLAAFGEQRTPPRSRHRAD